MSGAVRVTDTLCPAANRLLASFLVFSKMLATGWDVMVAKRIENPNSICRWHTQIYTTRIHIYPH